MLNAGIVLWLLGSSSLRAFVPERTAITWGLTVAIFLSITRFVAAMRRVASLSSGATLGVFLCSQARNHPRTGYR